jgi:hypothetical protein
MAAVEMTEPNRGSFAVRGGAIENRERIMQRGRLARRAETAVANQRFRHALERSDRQKERPGSGVDRAFRKSVQKLGQSIRQIAL